MSPLDIPILCFTWISILLSTVTLLIVILINYDFGRISFFLAPIAAGLTIILHATVLILPFLQVGTIDTIDIAYTPVGDAAVVTKRQPITTKWNLYCICFLCVLWTAAPVATIVVMALKTSSDTDFSAISYYIPVGLPGTVLEFTELNMLVVLALMIRSSRKWQGVRGVRGVRG
jgi:hypothetical protein